MCNFKHGFILCTCETETKPIVHNQNSRRYKNTLQAKIAGYRWSLARFVNGFDSEMEGSYELPSQDIGAELTAEWVLLNLNNGNCFDFDYIPGEGDNLIMKRADEWEYLSFIFTQGEWREDHYVPFSTTLQLMYQGEITPDS
jgi:hypothetical protein